MQEIAGDGQREAGRIPRTIECELTADLVDSCVPGDMVTITAIVKATGSEEGVPSLVPRPPPNFSKLLSPKKWKLVSFPLCIFSMMKSWMGKGEGIWSKAKYTFVVNESLSCDLVIDTYYSCVLTGKRFIESL